MKLVSSLTSLSLISVVAAAASESSFVERDDLVTKLSPLAFLQSLEANGTDLSSVIVSSSTDLSSIADAAQQVDQTSGVNSTAPPSQPVAATFVTATDGDIAANSTASRRRRSLASADSRVNKGNVAKRGAPNFNSGYTQVFGPSTTGKDASIQGENLLILTPASVPTLALCSHFSRSLALSSGTAYLTYKLVSNSTYNINDCLSFCDRVTGCVFANLYYEFNNPLYDWVFSEKSNLACALYGDVHLANEKTNFGGQQQKPKPEGLTYITQSSGFAKKTLYSPPAPIGYDFSFGPVNAANNAPFYMVSQSIN